jgi:hypothetical protein
MKPAAAQCRIGRSTSPEAARPTTRRPLRIPYTEPATSPWKVNGVPHQIDRGLLEPQPGKRTMLDVMLDIFGFVALFGQAALFLAQGRIPLE